MTKKFLVMTKNIQTDGDIGSPCIGRPQSLLGESYFQMAVASGVVPLFPIQAIHLQISTPPLRPAGVVEKGGFAAAAFGGRNTRLGISRHRCQEFRHDEIFEIETQTFALLLVTARAL